MRPSQSIMLICELMKECAFSREPVGAELGARANGENSLGGQQIHSPLAPATWSRGSREGENGIRSRANGVHN